MSNLDLGPKLKEQLALRAWPQLAGRVVGAHSRAEAVRDGVLIVATDTPAWAQELTMRRADLLAKLEKALGPGVISEIHFRSGFRAKAGPPEAQEKRPIDVSLPVRREQEISEATARIEDPELRRKAERAFTSLARITEWRRETGWKQCTRCGQWQRTGKRWCSSCTHIGKGSD
jgi:predicted nucleic acid-binding Zn ribbon protein